MLDVSINLWTSHAHWYSYAVCKRVCVVFLWSISLISLLFSFKAINLRSPSWENWKVYSHQAMVMSKSKQWWWVRARKGDEQELLLDFDYLLVMHIQTEIRMWLLYFRTCWCSWTLFSIPFQLFMSNSLIAFRFLCVCFCLCFCFEIGCLHRINMWLTCPNIVPYI